MRTLLRATSDSGWFPASKALAYKDAYALYVKDMSPSNPWVLKDNDGVPLYIPFGTKPYSQYAADITNPAFRAQWIDQAKALLAKGYRGLLIDDVNYYRKLARADGTVPTSSPCFAGSLTDALWRVLMVLFMAEVRQALPDAEIVHNVIWQVPETPEVAFGLRQCDYVEKEFGVVDPGITGGTGRFSLESLLRWVERRHAAGVSVVWDSLAKTDAEREYGLACYFLVSDGRDMLGSRLGGSSDDWWPGYDTELGKPVRGRERTLGSRLHYREFEHGHVYVNEPDAPPFTFESGEILGPATGAVVPS